MNPLLSVDISYRAIKSNKVRSFLTTLGIIIGVAAVISLVSITGGAKNMIEGQLASLGANSLVVNSGKRTKSGKSLFSSNLKPLTGKDVDAIRNLEAVKYVSPISNTAANIVSGNRSVFTAVIGTGKDFIFINDWFPEKGTFFNELDVRDSALICVLGKTAKENLFGSQDPVGKNIRIGKYTYRVIGVMSPIGPTPSGKDQDDIVLVPYTSVQKRLTGTKSLERITVFVDPAYDLGYAQAEIEKTLRREHGIKDETENDFYVKTQQTQIKTIKNVSRIMAVLLGSIASISLVVGGIGIMNIMLVSVGGKDQGNRNPACRGGEREEHTGSVSDRIRAALPCRRRNRNDSRNTGLKGRVNPDRLAYSDIRAVHTRGFCFLGPCGNHLRYISGKKSGRAQSNRCSEI